MNREREKGGGRERQRHIEAVTKKGGIKQSRDTEKEETEKRTNRKNEMKRYREKRIYIPGLPPCGPLRCTSASP